MRLKFLSTVIFALFFFACNTQKKSIKEENTVKKIDNDNISNNDKKVKEYEKSISEYKASETLYFDLINTKLQISFNIPEKQAYGTAVLTLKPHFYPADSLILDAKEFDIENVEILNKEKYVPVSYNYDNKKISIKTGKVTRNDTLKIRIKYTANPEKVKEKHSLFISGSKGLYFINADTENPQIWTQGETQSNSCWFPTIDSPNQKTTQDFYVTVNKDFVSLSNGKLVSSTINDDGTRTDYWKQTLPHAPYLAMIAVGKFDEINDAWRDIPLKVYFPEGKKEKAEKVFGNTAEMIEFYSRILNYDFPWDKYYQIAVKKFVTGAMENTGAVTFGEFVFNFGNEEQRIENEAVVAHELSHHWFGDLVTCESWANLPLNESFATYFEYLWIEHKYGRFIADKHLENDYLMYKIEYLFKNEDLIRFYHKHRDKMFDMHSYQKGGLILHMLRYTAGNEAFFKALNLYLNRKAYKTAEIHDLRLAFEEVTGEDYNWFFNQWFLNKGIPELKIKYSYNPENKTVSVNILQIQNLDKAPLYKIKTGIDIYLPNNEVVNKKIILTKQNQTFKFKVKTKPLFVNFDPDNAVLCKKEENYTIDEYIEILDKAPLYKDKKEALKALKGEKSDKLNEIYLKLMRHPFSDFRKEAIKRFALSAEKDKKQAEQYIKTLKFIEQNDDSPSVRKTASEILRKM